MPSNPNRIYADRWKDWGDFLETGRVKAKREDFLSFEEARAKARQAGISSWWQYQEWQKGHPNMPSSPDQTYADHWESWRNFLGTYP